MAQTAIAITNFNKIKNELVSKKYYPIYLLHGSENYFIDKATQIIENTILNEGEKEFNFSVLYGNTHSVGEVLETCKRYPMGAAYHLVIVKNAGELFSKTDEKTKNLFLAYCEKPSPTTILAFSHVSSKMDVKTKIYKALAQYPVLESIECKMEEGVSFIDYWLTENKKIMNQNAKHLLVDYVGSTFYALENELLKLYNNKGDVAIDENNVKEIVGFNRKYSPFELIDAISNKNYVKAMEIANHMAKSEDKSGDFIMGIGTLNYFLKNLIQVKSMASMGLTNQEIMKATNLYYSRFDQYKHAIQLYTHEQIMKAVDAVLEADKKFKGINAGNNSAGQIWQNMVMKILQ